MSDILSCDQFTQWLIDQQPVYDPMVLRDITPVDSWIGNVKTGTFPAHEGVERRLDRMRDVWANTAKVWTATTYAGCVGTPCDKTRHVIGWGSERIAYHLEEIHYKTPLLCFEQLIHVTHAVEQFEQIITDILRPATSAVVSMHLRKSALNVASKHLVTVLSGGAGVLTSFTFAWTTAGDEEIFFDCSVDPNNCGKLTPQALQVQFNPLMSVGYAGHNPFKDTAPFIELVTDIETCWELDRLGGATGVGGVPSINGNWRFTQWGDQEKYWRYGFSGQIGNFMVRTDAMGLRFQFVEDLGAGAAPNRFRYQLLLPYINQATAGAGGQPGLGREVNDRFQGANFGISFIMHKMGMSYLVADSSPINPEMPFMAKDYGGHWKFATDNLGADVNGCVIENIERDKGLFYANWKGAIRPEHTEFMVAYFHAREPMCVPFIQTCQPDTGYAEQSYSSDPGGCPVE